MNIQILKAALEQYVASAECSQAGHVKEAISAREELSVAESALQRSGAACYDLYPIPCVCIDDLINSLFYDDIGRIIKANMQGYSIDQMRTSVSSRATCISKATEVILKNPRFLFTDHLTREVLFYGIDFVYNLWLDNEAEGANRSDGSFDPDATSRMIAELGLTPLNRT